MSALLVGGLAGLILEGVDLDQRPVLRALLTDLEDLVHLGLELGYEEREGYVSKCHLCADIRRHLLQHGDFIELQPRLFYTGSWKLCPVTPIW